MECLKNYTFRRASSSAVGMTSIRSGEEEQDSVDKTRTVERNEMELAPFSIL